MPFSDARANAANNALWSTATKLRLFTASYAAQLAEIPFTIASSSATGGIATITVGSMPIVDAWEADGTAAAFRFLDNSNTMIAEGTGSWAVATSGAVVNLSSVTAVNGAPLNITSIVLTFPTKLAGEP
jgi:hypothetical protein